jgi:hypothetical protein
MLNALGIVLGVALLGVCVWGLGIAGSAVSDTLDSELPQLGWRDIPAHVPHRLRKALPAILGLVPLGAVVGFTCAVAVLLAVEGFSLVGPVRHSDLEWSISFILEFAAAVGAPLGVILGPLIYFRWLVGQHAAAVVRVALVAALGTITGGVLGGAISAGLELLGGLVGFGLGCVWAIRRVRHQSAA